MRLLLVEDEADLADALADGLRHEGYLVDVARDGGEAMERMANTNVELMILDRDLPRIPGDAVCRLLRSQRHPVRILMLTAAGTLDDRVAGLDLGADDYMAKPFDLKELEARVRALTRRGAGGGASIWKHGPLTYDQVGRIAYINEDMLDLSAREVGLLEILLQRVGRLVSKEQFVDHLCEWGEEVSNNAIEVYIHRLRKKIEVNGIRIATVRGLGYCLEKYTDKEAQANAQPNS